MSETTFNVNARRLEKQQARERDIADIAEGRATLAQVRARNGFFDALDPRKAKVAGRRKRVALDT
jgi:hypothetical protein